MAENLRTTRKRDGSCIPLIESVAAWTSAKGPGFPALTGPTLPKFFILVIVYGFF